MFTHDNLYTRLTPHLDTPRPTDQHQADVLQALRDRRPNPSQTTPTTAETP